MRKQGEEEEWSEDIGASRRNDAMRRGGVEQYEDQEERGEGEGRRGDWQRVSGEGIKEEVKEVMGKKEV